MRTRSKINKTDRINQIRYLYLEKNMSATKIAESLGLSVSSIRIYIKEGNIQRCNNTESSTKDKKENQSNIEKNNKEECKKPYIELDDNLVIYKGKVYEKLSRNQLKRMFKIGEF